MNPKFHLIKHTIALWTLLGVTILMLVMFIISWPVDSLSQMLWVVIIILLGNAILYGVGMWVWNVRIYKREIQPKEDDEEAWGV